MLLDRPLLRNTPRTDTDLHHGVVLDCILISLLASVVIAISASAPASTYAHAQSYQIDCVLDAAYGGSWLLPRSHVRGLDRKPPLYVWLAAPVVMLTGVHDDFVFRLPTVLATFLTAVLVYSFGRRWHGRSVGLMAACLWLTANHMAKLTYMALTDMLLAAAITASLFFADRLLFHSRRLRHRLPWVVAFWTSLLLGALAKGWGLVNGVLVGGTLLLAVGLRNGFRLPPPHPRLLHRVRLSFLLVVRRWRRAARGLHLGLGLLAFLAALLPILLLMLLGGGQEFRDTVYFEFWQRLTGVGPLPPRSGSTPALLHLLYFQLPVSVFALGAFFLVKPARWLRSSGPILFPLAWVLAVLLPFSFSHGSRPDYLLPCYAALALIAAWALHRLASLPPELRPAFSTFRWCFAAPALLPGLLLFLFSLNFLLKPFMSHELSEVIRVPLHVPTLTRAAVVSLVPLGILLFLLALRAARSWRFITLFTLTVIGMLGVFFMDRHIHSRHAATLDGETMRNFAKTAQPFLHDQPYLLCGAQETTVPLYLGRWGDSVLPLSSLPAAVNASSAPWLIISDKGLIHGGAAHRDPKGTYRLKIDHRRFVFRVHPEELGEIVLASSGFIETRDLGRLYLIRLVRPVRLSGTPVRLKHLIDPESLPDDFD